MKYIMINNSTVKHVQFLQSFVFSHNHQIPIRAYLKNISHLNPAQCPKMCNEQDKSVSAILIFCDRSIIITERIVTNINSSCIDAYDNINFTKYATFRAFMYYNTVLSTTVYLSSKHDVFL